MPWFDAEPFYAPAAKIREQLITRSPSESFVSYLVVTSMMMTVTFDGG